MEGAINFGLAAALKSAITINRGRVEQSNFHDYEVLRMCDAPATIDVHIVPSTEPPGGCLFGTLICGPHERVSVDFHPCPELL
jgi:CO/xanthine dehydrogenase Mo-binding subunit